MLKLLLLVILAGPPDVYSFSFWDTNGKLIALSAFRGKKILLVNTAGSSPHADQFASLERLYQQYRDSLVIIAFPSNDFGHETDGDSAIRKSAFLKYNIHYILASKTPVTGNARDTLYQWLTHSALNGRKNNEIDGDFYKFLIDESGHWMGVFSSTVDPMSAEMLNAIKK